MRRGFVVRTALALVAGALFVLLLRSDLLSPWAALAVDDLAQLAASSAAAVACARAARRATAGLRTAWRLLAAGTGSWAAGQVVWTVYELLLDRMPFPSVADVGFLAFPALAAAGLLWWLNSGVHAATRVRDLLDGTIIACSLLLLSWVTILAPVYAEGSADRLSFLLSLAYPLGDVVLATLVLLTLARSTRGQRAVLALLAAGLGGLAASDSAYLYLTTVGAYDELVTVGGGWVVGFLLIAVAAGEGSGAPGRAAGPAVTSRTTWKLRVVLPYVPMVAAEATITWRAVSTGRTDGLEVALGVVLVGLVLARQFLVLDENRRLVEQLDAARSQLHHQVLHDPLTGLANRALFADRVEHALAVREDRGRSVTVMFCDLDDFKAVNDRLGHAVGDALLRAVADRLRGCLRPADTVARLSGDEFAVLLEDPTDADDVASRLLVAVAEPWWFEGSPAGVTMSVGVATAGEERGARPGAPETGASLLRRADTAMYRAKAAGKGRAAGAAPSLLTS